MRYAVFTLYIFFIFKVLGWDDMFVMLSSWRLTNPSQSVEERMAQMMSTAAVSVTVTSLTDTLAFAFGTISPIPSNVIFSSYTTVAIVFSYFYAITFVAACMAYSGRRKASGLHVISCLKAVAKSEAGKVFICLPIFFGFKLNLIKKEM